MEISNSLIKKLMESKAIAYPRIFAQTDFQIKTLHATIIQIIAITIKQIKINILIICRYNRP